MKVHLPSFLLLMVFAVSAGSCNQERAAEEDTSTIVITRPQVDTAIVDTLTRVPDDGVAVETPAPAIGENREAPVNRPQTQPQQQVKKPQPANRAPATGNTQTGTTEAPAAGSPATGTPAADGVLREGSYRLVSVQEEALPLVLDMTTDCDSKLMRAELQLQNGSFRFRGLLAEECSGQIRKQEEHTAGGSYRLEGKRIFLNVQSGEILGDAEGVVEGTTIRLQQISNDDEIQEVDWVFRL
ncbi:hypothetical protein D770_14710 [Flammeovirgaceae bacterium 311]|nr:hypothetical protein D770_14710 [Flammeovirgaceae bacterium 311]